jgi:hypothetical protein
MQTYQAERQRKSADQATRRLPYPRLLGASTLLKGASPKPVLVRLAFRTALPLPQRVRAFAEALILRLMPEVLGAAFRATRLFPEQIGPFANDLVQALLRLRQHAMRIPERS